MGERKPFWEVVKIYMGTKSFSLNLVSVNNSHIRVPVQALKVHPTRKSLWIAWTWESHVYCVHDVLYIVLLHFCVCVNMLYRIGKYRSEWKWFKIWYQLQQCQYQTWLFSIQTSFYDEIEACILPSLPVSAFFSCHFTAWGEFYSTHLTGVVRLF